MIFLAEEHQEAMLAALEHKSFKVQGMHTQQLIKLGIAEEHPIGFAVLSTCGLFLARSIKDHRKLKRAATIYRNKSLLAHPEDLLFFAGEIRNLNEALR